jgi:fucose 4-O-acetylase-like acetyltransferase
VSMMQTRSAMSSGQARSERLVLFDGGKMLCALGVVMFHAHVDQAHVWYSGMFVFLFFIGFAPGSRRPETLGERVRRRAARILVPWLIWSAFYFAVQSAQGKAFPLELPTSWNWLLIGPTIHLWFLPFAFVGGVVCETLQGWLQGRSSAVFFGLTAALVSLVCFVWSPLAGLGAPFGQWQVSIPVVVVGLGLAMFGDNVRERAWIVVPVAAACLVSLALGRIDGALQTLIAGAFCLIAIEVKRPEISWLRAMGDHAFGVYLVHPFVILALAKLSPGIHQAPYILGISAFTGALALTWVLRLLPANRSIT